MTFIRFFIYGLFLSVISAVSGYSQSIIITVAVNPVTISGQNNGSVDITVNEGSPDFTYLLYSALPWDGGKEIAKSDRTSKTEYTFDQLAEGKYVVMVKDEKGNGTYEKIIVGLQSDLGWNNQNTYKQNPILSVTKNQRINSIISGINQTSGYLRLQAQIADFPESIKRL